MFNVYKNQQSRQTGSRNLMGPKTLPMIWGTNMKLVIKYQICVISSCWEKCDKKCAYMFNVYKNQLSRQTGSRNLTDPKTLPTIWHTYMKLVTKYQISAIESCWEKYLGRTEVKQYTPSPSGKRGYNYFKKIIPDMCLLPTINTAEKLFISPTVYLQTID
jgi:hypothetical protein